MADVTIKATSQKRTLMTVQPRDTPDLILDGENATEGILEFTIGEKGMVPTAACELKRTAKARDSSKFWHTEAALCHIAEVLSLFISQ